MMTGIWGARGCLEAAEGRVVVPSLMYTSHRTQQAAPQLSVEVCRGSVVAQLVIAATDPKTEAVSDESGWLHVAEGGCKGDGLVGAGREGRGGLAAAVSALLSRCAISISKTNR